SSGSLDFDVLIVGYEHVVMNCGSARNRLDVFGASIVSRMHRVLSRLGLTFYYRRERRSSRNNGSLICSSTLSCNTLQILLQVEESRVDEPELGKPELDKLEVGFDLG
nr:hypothetical protein [Tanacetum cinerariifolium]